jgi:chemotaxis family two-component system response regulator Rcp1
MNGPCILLVEDDPDDVELMRQVLRGYETPVNLHTAADGELALAFLRKEGPHAGAPDAALVLLDLNMPVMDGRQALAAMKADPRLKAIPVVVLTTSGNAQEIAASYALGANAFVTKPVGLQEFSRTVRGILDFWLTVAKLPS